MDNWKKQEDKELAFKRRYNRKVKVEKLENNLKDKTTIKLIYGTDEYQLEETRKEGLTEFVIVTVKDKSYKYDRYIDAEVFVADLIGG